MTIQDTGNSNYNTMLGRPLHQFFYRKPTQVTPKKGASKMVSAAFMGAINQTYKYDEQPRAHYPTQAEPDSIST